jgi:hypothetical protein
MSENCNNEIETNGRGKNGDLCRGFHKFRRVTDSELTQWKDEK